MNDQSEHLSNAQVEGYGNRTLATGAEQLPAQNQAEELEQHLAVCASCRARVLHFQRTHLALLPDDTMKTAPTADCPSEDDLRNLAAGLTSEPLAATLLQHASTCDHCGSLLRTFSESFSDEFTAEEKQAIASQRASSVSWQRETARKMLAQASARQSAEMPALDESRGVTSQRVRFFSRRWALVPAAAAAAAAIAVGIWYTQRDTPEKVEKLLAQAYTENRTIEMRWPGAEWDRANVTRGPS
ncbi:MAG TPA: hypothetical protein VFT65_11175, partial [Candidatus Angelobacter sp.]|nr:hypothetical protein [Candidatus Angelobacter sp.]